MNTKPNTPPDLFDRVARDLIEEVLGDYVKKYTPTEYERFVGFMIQENMRKEPTLRAQVEKVCRFVV